MQRRVEVKKRIVLKINKFKKEKRRRTLVRLILKEWSAILRVEGSGVGRGYKNMIMGIGECLFCWSGIAMRQTQKEICVFLTFYF